MRTVDPRVEPYLDDVARVVAELQSRFPADVVEPKSGVSVTLHWRPAPDCEAEIRAVARELGAKYGLALLETRMAIELRPPIDVDKGDAANALIAGFDVAAFVGDDTGDLPAFAELARARDEGRLDTRCASAWRRRRHRPSSRPRSISWSTGPPGVAALLARVADEIG